MRKQKAIERVVFICPKCGTELDALTQSGAVRWSPPVCACAHAPTECEQRFIGADAFSTQHPGDQEGTE